MKTNYRPEIDGLRSIAVLAVIFFHADFSISFSLGNKYFQDFKIFEGGYIGVDVFFVISGYLITSLILNGLKNKSFSFLNFYERRARRLLPALFTVIIFSIPLSFIYFLPKQMEMYSLSALSTLLFSSNFWFWLEDGYSYWTPINQFKPLLHTWSLAVEEQFYILYPIFLVLTFSYLKKYFTSLLILIFFISLQLSQFGSENYIVANFYLLPTRGWELIAGAILAKIEFSRNRQKHFILDPMMPLVGLLIILNSFIIFNSSTPHPSIFTFYPIFGTMLIIWFAKKGEIVGNILSSKVLVYIGKISYSLYLWHFLLFSFAHIYYQQTENIWRNIELDFEVKIIIIIFSFILSILTYIFIETPFRSKKKIQTKKFLPIIISVFALLILFFSYSYKSRGFTENYVKKNPFYSAYIPIEENTPPKMYQNNDCKFHAINFGKQQKERLVKCNKKYDRALIILGDSHAMNLYNMVFAHSNENFVFGLANGGCRANEGNCHYSEILGYLKNQKFSSIPEISLEKFSVVYIQSGSYLFSDPIEKLQNRELFRSVKVRDYDLNLKNIVGVEKYLLSLSNYVKTIWFGSRIEPSVDPKEILKNGCNSKRSLNTNIKNNFVKLDKFLKDLSIKKDYLYLSQVDAINFDEKKDFFNCSEIFWRDGDHFSEAGIKHFAPRILKKLNIK